MQTAGPEVQDGWDQNSVEQDAVPGAPWGAAAVPHCAAMGWPILGDPQYGPEAARRRSCLLGLETQQLCACSLELVHPITGERLMIRSEMDVDLEGLF